MTTTSWLMDRSQLYRLLSGSGSQKTMAMLNDVRRTRNLLLLRGLLDIVGFGDAHCGQTAQFPDNFAALFAIESLKPKECATIIAHPLVGAWLVTCLKRMSSQQQAERPRPLWADLGHLGAITIAAAIAADANVDATVPTYDGTVVIPTIGLIRVGDAPSWKMTALRHLGDGVLTTVDSGKVIAVRKSPDQKREVHHLRRLSASCDGLTMNIELDDLSPYRDCHSLGASDRLSDGEVEDWGRTLAEGWEILATRHRAVAESIARGLHTIVPLTSRGLSGVSATSRHSPGAVALTPPRDGTSIACTLVHELQHTKLWLVMELAPLTSDAKRQLYYSPWRDDPRPLTGLMQGLYACVAVADFWRVEDQHGDIGSVASFQLARARRQVRTALDSLSSSGPQADEMLVAAVRDVAASSQDVPVSKRCARLADDITLDHAVRWKLRNLTPTDGDVELLAASWRAGIPPLLSQTAVILSGNGESFTEHARLRAVYAMLLNEDSSRTRTRGSSTGLPDVTSSDLRLIQGEYGAAAVGYERQIRARIRSIDAWAGLAVALHGQSELATAALTLCPELVRAVYERLALEGDVTMAPSPVDVARWMVPVAASQDGNYSPAS